MKKLPNKKNFSWGQEATRFFYELQPEQILDAVERFGYRCTGRTLALNSLENRVFEIEVDDPALQTGSRAPSVVAKFYRPGRWTREQILAEHTFLQDLIRADIPVVAPLADSQGQTLMEVPELKIWCAIFPKKGGRHAEELDHEQIERVGRLFARLHIIGRERPANERIRLDADSYGLQSLDFLLKANALPKEISPIYKKTVEEICQISQPWFGEASVQRIHGDAHPGNLLWTQADGPCWLDFDDMAMGPPVQDIWLLTAGRDADSLEQRESLLAGYESMADFDRSTLRLIEPLRALRYIHFSAWISKRWEDPAFPRAFPQFGSMSYWREQLDDLMESLNIIREIS